MTDAFGATPVTRGSQPRSLLIVAGSTTLPARRRSHWLTLAGPVAVAALLTGLVGYSAFGGRMSLAQPVRTFTPPWSHPTSTRSVPAIGARSKQAAREPAQAPLSASSLIAGPSPVTASAIVATASSTHAPTALDPKPRRNNNNQSDQAIDHDGRKQGSGQVAASTPVRDDCAPNSQHNDCIYADVLLADRRLRAAYTQAVRRGVPTTALAPALRRWRQARAIAQERPDGAIRLYGALAYDLDGYAADDVP